jgi:hypothetical protein
MAISAAKALKKRKISSSGRRSSAPKMKQTQ